MHASYGTLDQVKAFIHAAHDRQIRVLFELVVNHTSDQHPWFQRARLAPPGSPERAFYVWSDTDTRFPETRIIFSDTERSNWAWDPVAKQYYWHRFFSHQPDLNHNNPAVVDAVIDVMKFWLELGVDGLRLDAVPYLCLREGTRNENLPETHDVLKRMRRELDRAFSHRMLLAEANQWPADVRAYFGEGDECHMAFHFPLMPRMFMALRQEDRHAITEILNQTPDIPDTCQWALFLRNHDELTLEMVTDEERDYMYQTYAGDPQMRLNLGIRRRLAPLVENSRRRIELLTALLCSLPGTPVIYYGDEIGMGDNVYLGDRNGVRTPMQWSAGKNGGFSHAEPSQLYAPTIADPVYGYQAINVEAQERSPFSLLHWTKRLISLRKRHKVFGRGSLELLYPLNRKVLAYLRRDADETVLVVANLSNAVQPVEIDLNTCAGLVPVEMHGRTRFPRIGAPPYVLTIGPYGCYWFELQQSPTESAPTATRVTPVDPTADLVASLPDLLVGADWQGVFDSATRDLIERRALVPFLRRQRWFGAGAREVSKARFSDWGPLRTGRLPAFFTTASVAFADGGAETFSVPLAFVADADAVRVLDEQPAAVLARITGARKGLLVDGLLDDLVCDRLLDLVDRGPDVVMARGVIKGVARPAGSSALDRTSPRRWLRRDHHNSVVWLHDRLMLKLYRRIEPGTHPEVEILRALPAYGFLRSPSLEGAIAYERTGLDPGTLATIQTTVVHQGSGWDFTLDDLRRYFEQVGARARADLGDPSSRETVRSLERYYLASVATLGTRTAELHAALASAKEFAPEPLDRDALQRLGEGLTQSATLALDRLAAAAGSLTPPAQERARAVLALRTTLLERLAAVGRVAKGGMRLRIHGDYHLGQVLRTEEDFVLLDFEGDPRLPLAERREKQSPLKDVAAMLRSFGYAASASVRSPADDDQWADLWQREVTDAFVSAYRASLGPAAVLPEGDAFDVLLRAFMIDKAFRELGHELERRPDWAGVPLAGLQQLA